MEIDTLDSHFCAWIFKSIDEKKKTHNTPNDFYIYVLPAHWMTNDLIFEEQTHAFLFHFKPQNKHIHTYIGLPQYKKNGTEKSIFTLV